VFKSASVCICLNLIRQLHRVIKPKSKGNFISEIKPFLKTGKSVVFTFLKCDVFFRPPLVSSYSRYSEIVTE